MAIECSVLYNDLIFDLPANRVNWCCKHIGGSSITGYNPSEYFRDPTLTDIRDSLATDRRHRACAMCWDAESRGVNSWRQIYGQMPHRATDPESIRRQVTRMEIKLNRTCDLACIYCGPAFSTSWEKENERTGLHPPINMPEYGDGLSKIRDTLVEIGKHNRDLMMEFTGGEPFLSRHLTEETLEGLIEAYKRFNHPDARLVLKFTSNANTPEKILYRVIDHLGNLKSRHPGISIRIALSLESTGRFTEASRYLCEWERLDSNINLWLSQAWVDPMISSSFNALTLPDLPNFLVYLSDVFPRHGKPIKISSNVVYRPLGLAPSVLPRTFERYLDDAMIHLISMRHLFEDESPDDYDALRKTIGNMRETLGSTMENKPELKLMTDYCIKERRIDLEGLNPELYRYVYASE